MQPLNVKLVIKNPDVLAWLPIKKLPQPLSFSLFFWMDFISHLVAGTISQCAWISSFNYILKYYS